MDAVGVGGVGDRAAVAADRRVEQKRDAPGELAQARAVAVDREESLAFAALLRVVKGAEDETRAIRRGVDRRAVGADEVGRRQAKRFQLARVDELTQS